MASSSTSSSRYQPLSGSPATPSTDYLSPDHAFRTFSGNSESTLYDAGADGVRDFPAGAAGSDIEMLELRKRTSTKSLLHESIRRVSDADRVSQSSLLLEKHFPAAQPAKISVIKDWWIAEVGASFLSAGCMIAVAAVLFKIHNTALADWNFVIAPNSLLSVLLTLAKTLMLLAVAESLTQLKWRHFERSRPLSHFQAFDDASKGPFGAIQLIWKTRGTAFLASIGALIVLLSLAMDPFAQQILAFPNRLVPETTARHAHADIAIARKWGNIGNSTPVDMGYPMQRAVYGGLFSDSEPTLWNCPTGNCTFDSFDTLGVCQSCSDISTRTRLVCQKWNGPITNNTDYECWYHSPSGGVFKGCSNFGMQAPEACFFTNENRGRSKFTAIANIAPNLTTLVNFVAIHIPKNRAVIRPNVTMPRGTIVECSIDWCARSYRDWNVTNNRLYNSTNFTSPLLPSPYDVYTGLDVKDAIYKSTDPIPGMEGNLTFGIAGRESTQLKSFLANLFTTSLNDSDPSANWPPKLSPKDQITMSRALFQANGGSMKQTVAALAISLDTLVRNGQYGEKVNGTTYKSETYINVNWPWLIMPTVLVLFGIVFLLAALVQTWWYKTVQWKSSSLAPLFHGLEGWSAPELNVHGRRHMEAAAEHMHVQLRPDERGEIRFVRANG